MNPDKDPFQNQEMLPPAAQLDPAAQRLLAEQQLKPQFQQEQTTDAYEQWMTQVWENSLENAKQGNVDSTTAIEQASNSEEVSAARKAIESYFDNDAKTLEEKSTQQALEETGLADHESAEIAEAIIEGDTLSENTTDPLINMSPDLPATDKDSRDAVKGIRNIRNRNNGMTSRYVNKLVKNTSGRLEKLGIKNTVSGNARRAEIAGELAAFSEQLNGGTNYKELDITNQKMADRAMDDTVGKELLNALGSPKKMTGETRKQLFELWKQNPSVAKEVFEAASVQKQRGTVNELTARRVGHAVNSVEAHS
jgi:hypothetical protein